MALPRVTSIKRNAARSRITNGSRMLPASVEARSAWSRRFRDVYSLIVSDLGGEANLAEAEKAISRRAALLEVELERIEATLAEATKPAATLLAQYSTLANTQRRLFEAIGLRRRQKDITPSPLDHYASRSRNGHARTIDHDD